MTDYSKSLSYEKAAKGECGAALDKLNEEKKAGQLAFQVDMIFSGNKGTSLLTWARRAEGRAELFDDFIVDFVFISAELRPD